VRRSPSLPEAVRVRPERKDGEIVLTAGNFRTQEGNRRDAVNRLVHMTRQGGCEASGPTRAAHAKPRRLTVKAKRVEAKHQRRSPVPTGD
jgi:ribosome-associated protein